MSVFYRLIAQAGFHSLLLPIVAINLAVQLLHLAGLTGYDGEKASYLISGAYIVSIVMEAASLLRDVRRPRSFSVSFAPVAA